MRQSVLVIVALFPLFLTACVATEQRSATPDKGTLGSVNLEKALPVDPFVDIGKLDNGFTYYVRQNQKPAKRLELMLVVNAGSVLEDDDQLGLAHFLEHMAFRGTAHFPKHELVDYLESIGMRFGPDLNAFTSFDETVYILQVPTDNPDVVEKAFLILKEWAHSISLESEDIAKERNVILEELRLRRGAEKRMMDREYPILFKGSRYANRLPIGKEEILETFDDETLRRFFRDWYRTDQMALIAVGDYDKSHMVSLIRKYFSDILTVEDARAHPLFPVPGHEETLFSRVTDPEATHSSIRIYYKHDRAAEITVGDYRRSILKGLYTMMLNERLNERTKLADPPFLFGFSSRSSIVREKDFFILSIRVKDNAMLRGLDALLTEVERVRLHGFTQTELERQEKQLLRQLQRMYEERDKTDSRHYASEYMRHFQYQEPIPGIEYEYMLHQELLPSIGLDEINALSKDLITEGNRVITLNAPEKQGIIVPSEHNLIAVVNAVSDKIIEPYVDSVTDQPLMKTPPVPAEIVTVKEITSLGIHEWVLSNGVRVILKSTDFKNDEVRFSAFSPGGHSLVPDEDHTAAITASSLIIEGGTGTLNFLELKKKLAGKSVRVSPHIGELWEGISGFSSPKDMETMFQLIYLYFTQPRKDDQAFLSYQSRMRGLVENRNARPETAFEDTVTTTLTQNHHRRRPWSAELLEEMDLVTSYEIYTERFADASDFTFFFVGAFDLSRIRPLVLLYLGGLPSLYRDETWRDVEVVPPQGAVTRLVKKGMEPKSRVKIVFTGPFTWTYQNRYDLQSMISFLNIKLRETLRDELGGTYDIGIWAEAAKYPKQDYRVTISFGTSPVRVDELTEVVFDEIQKLKTDGVPSLYLRKIKEMQRRKRETDLKKNTFWLSSLQFYYRYGEDPMNILEYGRYIDNLTSEAIRKSAQRYFDTNNYLKVVLLPGPETQK